MSRKGENIYKRKDGRWEGRYMKGRGENSKIYYGYVYGKSHREVRERMKKIMFELNQSQNIRKKQNRKKYRFIALLKNG